MRLNTNSAPAVGHGMSKVGDFRMAMNPKAARVLSDNLYKDSHGSIIRELSCNAYDAHCMVGKPDLPFDITLPDRFSNDLRIRDYGPGISPEDINDVYAVYFASTKDQDNDAVGAFGLGSKTPFALTDSFMVISRHNGIKRTYNAYMDEGMPGISQFGDGEETDEPDGLEVIITVKDRDIQIFREKVISELRFFPVKPNVYGQTIDWPKIEDDVINVAGFRYFKHDGGNSLRGMFIKLGPVAYPIDFNEIRSHYARKDKTIPSVLKFMEGKDGDMRRTYGGNRVNGGYIDMPIGTVEVTPSREALSYTEYTLDNIEKVIDRISDELFKTVRDEFHRTYDDNYPEFIEYFNKLDPMLRGCVDADYVEKHFKPFVINPRTSKLSLKVPEKFAKFTRKTYMSWRGEPELSQKVKVNEAWTTKRENIKDYDKDGEPIPVAFTDTNDHRFTLEAFVNNDARIYFKDEAYAFSVRCFQDNMDYDCDAREYYVIENCNDADGFYKYLAKYLGNERVRYVSETAKVSVGSGIGHSITGGKTRSWFEITDLLVRRLNSVESMFNRTLYKLNAYSEFEATTDDLEDQYGKDEVVFFTAFNNKMDRPENMPDARMLFNYLFNVLDVKVIAIPRSKAKKFSKLDCAISVDDLIKKERDTIVDMMRDEMDSLLVKEYDSRVNRVLMRLDDNFLELLKDTVTDVDFDSWNDGTTGLLLLSGVGRHGVEQVLEILDASDIADYFSEAYEIINGDKKLTDIEAHFVKHDVSFVSFKDAMTKTNAALRDPANAKKMLKWSLNHMNGHMIYDPMQYQSFGGNDGNDLLLDFHAILGEIVERVA